MKYLVTGGAGFIGSHIVDKLLREGNSVFVIDNLSGGKKSNVNTSAKFYNVDITSPDIAKIFEKEKPEVVFHFAAHIEARESAKDPINDARINILGSLNILENCRKFGVKKVIFSSSGGEVYGSASVIPTPEDYIPSPISPYGIAKLTFEKYLEAYSKIYGIKFVAIRYGNIYGPRQNPHGESGIVAIFINKMLNGEKVFIHGSGKQTKDYLFIDDAVSLAISVSKGKFNGVVNAATGKETSVIEIFNKLKKLTNSKVKAEHIPLPSISFPRGALSIKKAEKEVKWKPKYNIDKGLELTVEWFLKQDD